VAASAAAGKTRSPPSDAHISTRKMAVFDMAFPPDIEYRDIEFQ
jgi:hypothetical protein